MVFNFSIEAEKGESAENSLITRSQLGREIRGRDIIPAEHKTVVFNRMTTAQLWKLIEKIGKN